MMKISELDEHLKKLLPEELEFKQRYIAAGTNQTAAETFDLKTLKFIPGRYEIYFDMKMNTNIMIHRHWRYYPHNFHTHKYIEIMYMYSGSGTNVTETETSELSEGDLLILTPNVWHLPKIDDESLLINFIVRPAFLELFVGGIESDGMIERSLRALFNNDRCSKFIHIHSGGDPLVRKYASEIILTSINSDEKNRMIERECFFKLMILRLVSGFEDKTRLSQHFYTQNYAIEKIHNLIAAEYKSITLDEAAEKLNYSKSHICKTLKANTGNTFSEVVNRLRIRFVCAMLTESRKPVSKIAAEAGYTSIEYFNRTFKSLVGISPGEYRNKAENHAALPTGEGKFFTPDQFN